MTTQEYAKRYNRSRTIVLKFCRTGRLPAHRVMERGQWRWEIEGTPPWPESYDTRRRKPWREGNPRMLHPRPPVTAKEKSFAAMMTALKRTGRYRANTSLNWEEIRITFRQWQIGLIEESRDVSEFPMPRSIMDYQELREATGNLLREAM